MPSCSTPVPMWWSGHEPPAARPSPRNPGCASFSACPAVDRVGAPPDRSPRHRMRISSRSSTRPRSAEAATIDGFSSTSVCLRRPSMEADIAEVLVGGSTLLARLSTRAVRRSDSSATSPESREGDRWGLLPTVDRNDRRRRRREFHVGVVTTYPPSDKTLNEYAVHLVTALAAKPEIETLTVFDDATDDGRATVPTVSTPDRPGPSTRGPARGESPVGPSSGRRGGPRPPSSRSFGDARIAAALGLFSAPAAPADGCPDGGPAPESGRHRHLEQAGSRDTAP